MSGVRGSDESNESNESGVKWCSICEEEYEGEMCPRSPVARSGGVPSGEPRTRSEARRIARMGESGL